MNVIYKDENYRESLKETTDFLVEAISSEREEPEITNSFHSNDIVQIIGKHLLLMARYIDGYPDEIKNQYPKVVKTFFNETIPDWVEYEISQSLEEKFKLLGDDVLESIEPHIDVV